MSQEQAAKKPFTWRSVLPYLIAIAVLAAVLSYLYRNADRYKHLFSLSIGSLGALFVLVLVTILFNGLSNYTLFRGLGAQLSINESIGLATINSLANQLTFSTGGLITISIYLKKRFGLSYVRFVSAALAFYVLAVAANGILGVMVLTWWAATSRMRAPLILFIAFGGMAGGLLLLKLPVRFNVISGRWKERLSQVFDGLQTLLENRLLVGKMLLYQVVVVIVYSIQLYIAFHALSQGVTLGQCTLFSAANILTQAISFTPDAIGVREAVVAGIAAILGYGLGVSVVAVGLCRVVNFPTVLAIGGTYTYVLSRRAVKAQCATSSGAGSEEIQNS